MWMQLKKLSQRQTEFVGFQTSSCNQHLWRPRSFHSSWYYAGIHSSTSAPPPSNIQVRPTLLYQLRQGCTTSGSSIPCSSMYQMLKLKLGPQDIRGTEVKQTSVNSNKHMTTQSVPNCSHLFWQICRGTSARRSCALRWTFPCCSHS